MPEPRQPAESGTDPLRGRLDCFDGRYRYRCEQGHRIVTEAPHLDVCPAVLPWPTVDDRTPCGADIDMREVDYRGESDTGEARRSS